MMMKATIAMMISLLGATTAMPGPSSIFSRRALRGGRAGGGGGGGGGRPTCSFDSADAAVASLEACGGATSVAALPSECSNRCGREFLPLYRVCSAVRRRTRPPRARARAI
eukprot:SAG31_NODE_5764_length_2337_cov_2.506702_3_plen_111_part_00